MGVRQAVLARLDSQRVKIAIWKCAKRGLSDTDDCDGPHI